MVRDMAASTPFVRLEKRLGGIKVMAALADRTPKSLYRWNQPTAKGGCGGLVPGPAQRRMVANAERDGIELSFADFAPKPGEVIL